MIFSKEHIDMIFSGEKTMTRRLSGRYEQDRSYAVQPGRGKKAVARIYITSKKRQKLRAITPEDAWKEGGYTVVEFVEEWKKLHGKWNPDLLVWVYEFILEFTTDEQELLRKRLESLGYI